MLVHAFAGAPPRVLSVPQARRDDAQRHDIRGHAIRRHDMGGGRLPPARTPGPRWWGGGVAALAAPLFLLLALHLLGPAAPSLAVPVVPDDMPAAWVLAPDDGASGRGGTPMDGRPTD